MYGLGMLKGMMVTIKHLFRPPFTVQYPEEVRPIPARARTNLLWFEERCPRSIHRYEIDFRICMYCGLCVEACPYDAIQAGGTFKDAVYSFDDMYKDKHALTVL